jgi:hypothetical protein
MAAPASRTRQANFSRSRICPSVDWSSVLTLAYPTTAMVRSMLKVWQAGLQPRSRPFPNYRWSDGIFKPCACLQPSGCELAQGLKIPLPGGSLVLDSPDRRTLPKNGGHWPVLRPGSSDLAALNRVSKPRIVGFRARIGGFPTRDEPLPPVAGTASRSSVPGKPAVHHRSRPERFRQSPTSADFPPHLAHPPGAGDGRLERCDCCCLRTFRNSGPLHADQVPVTMPSRVMPSPWLILDRCPARWSNVPKVALGSRAGALQGWPG